MPASPAIPISIGSFSTFVDILQWRAQQQGEQRSYTFLNAFERATPREETHLNYKELDLQARVIAAQLQKLNLQKERALLLYPPGLEFISAFLGCLYAGVVAIPAYPPDPYRLERSLLRLQSILEDAEPKVILTTSMIASLAQNIGGDNVEMGELIKKSEWLATDVLDGESAEAWQKPNIVASDLAFLQYTSGSTSQPKGVMVTHACLMHNQSVIQTMFEYSTESVVVGWLPLYHDMGLIGNVLQPLYTGFPCILMSPLDFLQHPMRWLEAISRFKATTSGGPNFAYELCVKRISPEQAKTLDLSSWDIAFNGAEPVRHETLERFYQTFQACGFRKEAFYPCYGLAEATLMVSGGSKRQLPVVGASEGNSQKSSLRVGCGWSYPDQEIRIVEPATQLECAPGMIGEIWVRGPSIAAGYWNKPSETLHTFQATLAGAKADFAFLRTGDLGFIKDGELFVTGRFKDLIIVGGLNYHPEDIEATIEKSHASLRPGCIAAFAVEGKNGEQLIIAAELETASCDVQDVERKIRDVVQKKHEIPVHQIVFLKPRTIPKTSSGKVQRHACRHNFLNDTLELACGDAHA